MFPFSWLEQLSFSGASLLYVITSSMAGNPPIFEKQTISGTLAEPFTLSTAYGFVFPSTGSIRSPVTIAQTANYVAGDRSCDSDSGESQANSCYDCGCFSGSYCDAAKGCTLTSQLTASLSTIPVTSFGDCRISHTFNVSVRANNPPTGLSLVRANYSINSTTGLTVCTGNPFVCPVTAPAAPGWHHRRRGRRRRPGRNHRWGKRGKLRL